MVALLGLAMGDALEHSVGRLAVGVTLGLPIGWGVVGVWLRLEVTVILGLSVGWMSWAIY